MPSLKSSRDKRNSGKEFEKEIIDTLPCYDSAGLARVMMMPVPTKQIGSRSGMPLLVRCGKAPFDLVGYALEDGRMIGAELKASDSKSRLPIVAPAKKGDGVQFHQLDALAGLARAGGIARLVWSNGGEVGVLTNSGIVTAHSTYCHALAADNSGRKAPKGSRSIEWEAFRPALTSDNDLIWLDWLLLDS